MPHRSLNWRLHWHWLWRWHWHEHRHRRWHWLWHWPQFGCRGGAWLRLELWRGAQLGVDALCPAVPLQVRELHLHKRLAEKTRLHVQRRARAWVAPRPNGCQDLLAARDVPSSTVAAQEDQADARKGAADKAAAEFFAAQDDMAPGLYTRPAFEQELRGGRAQATLAAPASGGLPPSAVAGGSPRARADQRAGSPLGNGLDV